MLNANRRIVNAATRVVFFNGKVQEGIYLEEDNRTGAGEGDDERIHVDLDAIPADVTEIIFNVNIYESQKKRQTFGMVKNSYIRLLDEDDNCREVAKYELKENASNSTAVTFASMKRMKRMNGGWSFEAIGDALVVADLNQLLLRYM